MATLQGCPPRCGRGCNPPCTSGFCRADAGDCDVPEFCDGAGNCPANAFEPNGSACGSQASGSCALPGALVALSRNAAGEVLATLDGGGTVVLDTACLR